MNKDELSRYSRNILLSEIGRLGQERLGSSQVIVVGAGGLGSPLLYYLVAAGVGHIRCIENDTISLTNLQRQILYTSDDIGKLKSKVAESRLNQLNPNIDLQFDSRRLTPQNGPQILNRADLVLDGSDNFATRFLVNDLCQINRLPLISGGILRFYGMLLGVLPQKTPCYRCVFEHQPEPGSVPSCSAAGVIGAIAGTIGSLMAAEAIKYLVGMTPNIMGNMVRIDLKTMEFRMTELPKNPNCSYCNEPMSFNPNDVDYFENQCATPFSIDNLS